MQALKRPSPPSEVKSLFTDEEFKNKQAYQLDKLRFSMLHSLYDTASTIIFLWAGYYALTWNLAGQVAQSVGFSNEIAVSIAWVLILSVTGTVFGLPWSLYSTFVLEAKHGFNKTTPLTFVSDMIKSLMLTAVLSPPIIAGVVWILQHTGPRMVLGLWAFIFTLSLLMMTLYPVLIAPLFNKYTPLPEGSLRSKIEALAASLSFPLKKLFLVDGSTRSAHSNAYMYGFFKNKRIVLYDTLINQCSEEQVVAVLAHELGHWKLKHTAVLFIATQAILAAQLAVFAAARGAPGLFEAFGFAKDQRPALAALVLFQALIGPVDEVLGLVQNIVSRRFEFQADAFGVGLGHGPELRKALCMLDKENKGPPNVDTLYSAYHFSHPPLPERLKAIDAALKKGE